MIPWRINFSGIRDYRPEQIDLSGNDDHVMITGPNGSGKSTITYCFGAVLHSSKVDIGGLRSRNLMPNETWRANISFVFKNDGLIKIDAPTFVQFTLKIVQEPEQPIKKEYYISTGDELDQWEYTEKYSSGDRQFNFGAYKKSLLQKYKIDPDAYYLIWYQQEVNQFAVMAPEERFRIFSEMHGIDQTQREWEESIEKLKDTTEILKNAENSVNHKKYELKIKKGELDRFKSNQERLFTGGKRYTEALVLLESKLKKEKQQLERILEELQLNKEEVQEIEASNKIELSATQQEIKKLETEKGKLEAEIGVKESEQDTLFSDLEEKKEEIKVLEKELENLTKRKDQMELSEGEVKRLLAETENSLAYKQEMLSETIEMYENESESHDKLLKHIASLRYQIKTDKKLSIDHQKKLDDYKSSYEVSANIAKLEARITNASKQKLSISNNLERLNEKRVMLQEDRDLSTRQIQSLSYIRSLHIKAYALSDLVELDDNAKLEDEKIFQTIKYTIFFQGKQIQPPNDLYHVSLMDTIPDRSITEIPDLHLRIKETIKAEDVPHAIKVLWWIEQFFKGRHIQIRDNKLFDDVGIRGPQEEERYILSKKALLLRKKELAQLIISNQNKLNDIDQLIVKDRNVLQELNGIIFKVREAEAFMTARFERDAREKELRQAEEKLSQIKDLIEGYNETKVNLQVEIIELKNKLENLKKAEQFYIELGKMKGKYDQLLALRQRYTLLNNQYEQLELFISNLEITLKNLEKKFKQVRRKEDQLDEEVEKIRRESNQLSQQIDHKKDEEEATAQQLVFYIGELTDVKELIPEIYSTVITESSGEQVPSLAELKRERENSKVMFEGARGETGIDPSAQENYDAVKQEYERLQDEFNRTNLLLEQDRERAEQLQDKLETTISMRVMEIRRRFESYMQHFQFEGEVDWEATEDRRGRTNFKLYIKARKEGHRGTMEDVSTKARGGKVGKGVSGGEESLSSLLFALALLQNLSYKPGFIVLDEFDSALDESRKLKVFDLYVKELNRKMIILTPKSHEEHYLARFSKALVIQHDPTVPSSKVVGIIKKDKVANQ